MRIVFFGTPEWAATALARLAASAHTIAGVVTAPDAPVGRSKTPQPPAVKAWAEAHGVGPILQPSTLKGTDGRRPILDLAPEALVVVAYGRILPGRLLDAPRYGAINLHFSLLPKHRGASPVQHTILGGDPEAGVSTMLMDRGLDTGPILLQRAVPIGLEETTAELGLRLAEIGGELLIETLDRLAAIDLTPTPQDETAASWAPVLRKEDGFIDWRAAPAALARRVRAFTPWPPVVCNGPKGTLRLIRVQPLAEPAPSGSEPGAPLRQTGEAVDLVAGGGILRVLEIQPAGGKPMTAAAALRGQYLALGQPLLPGGSVAPGA